MRYIRDAIHLSALSRWSRRELGCDTAALVGAHGKSSTRSSTIADAPRNAISLH